jgi:hypothetical protein
MMTEGNIWIIQRPPSNWNCNAYGTRTKIMNTSAPIFTAKDATFATAASCAPIAFGAMKSAVRWSG